MKNDCCFQHGVKTRKKPWTHLNFGDRGNGLDFTFGIVSDRTGRVRPGVFEKAIAILNRMRPDFVMSVGDFIEGVCFEDQSDEFIKAEWAKIRPEIEKSIQPFFYVVGNHDFSDPLANQVFPGLHERSKAIWENMFGTDYYWFIYKKVLFLCLNSSAAESGLGETQIRWALHTISAHADVRWTFVFLHRPEIWMSPDFKKIEDALYERNYTVFSGDLHRYAKYVRNGRKYIMLGTTGGGDVRVGQGARGVPFGEFDHIMWVSMCGDGPEITPIALDGIYDENVVTTEKITWLTPKYFRANKKISPEEAMRLQTMGIKIEETQF